MYYLFILGKIIALSLPRNVSYFLGKLFALGQFYCFPQDREAVLYNLVPLVKDQKVRRRIAKQVFINFAYYLVDFFRYSCLNSKFIQKYVSIQGLENVDQVLARNQGAVLATAHLGNYELGGAIMAILGYPLAAVALPHLDLKTNNFFNNQRKRVGIEVIPTGLMVKESIAVLRKGRLLAILGDRDFSNSGSKQKIFSRYAYIPRGMAFFAKKGRAAVIPAFFVRENKYFYRLIFEKEIKTPSDLESRSDYQDLIIKNYLKVLEKYLKKYPEQWYLFQKYWR